LTVERRGESGRAVSLRLDEKEVPAEDFRIAVGKALGWNRVPSTWFEVSQKGDSFFFRGRGWGHGVGLCQTGAAAMAAQGHKANDILSNYFPGTDVNDELTGDPWKSFAGQGLLLQSLDASDAIYLPEIERARSEAERVSGLSAPESFMLRAFPSTTAFRDATLAPGWIAAFTQGSLIASQPLRTLSARGLLQRTMRHEFLHALVEREAGPRAPLWFREGLVELWGGGCPADALMKDHAPQLTLDAIDALLAHSASERESQAAHRAACERSAGLINRYGRTTLLSWLHSGLPDGIVQAVPTAGGTQAK
jgi:stage II sporulation protein D